MRKNRFVVDFVDNKVSVSKVNTTSEENKTNLPGTIEKDDKGFMRFVPNKNYENFDTFFSQFIDDIVNMKLSRKNSEKVVHLCKKLIQKHKELHENILKSKNIVGVNAFDAFDYVCQKLSSVESSYRMKNELKKRNEYVPPIEKAIGLKWKTVLTSESDLPDHQYINATFQFVPVSKTLKEKFSNDNFRQTFLEYNESRQHECNDNMFRDFCCGSTFRSFAKDDIFIEIGLDEFDVCCPLKSKSTIHKILGVYFRVRNMPPQFSSRLDNIYLVALCESINFKEHDMNDVINEIVRDLLYLEKNGIDIAERNLKVHLTTVCSDNLGANTVLGFSGSFSATFYCRFCEHSNVECQKLIQINTEKMRTAVSYGNMIKKIDLNPEIEQKKTKGVRYRCLFNELKSYDVLSNGTVDVMHDILEGIVPFFLYNFFQFCINKKIANEAELIQRIRDHTYGSLNSRNKPSKLNIKRANLGQNASQIYCIVTHVPFIFNDKRQQLKEVFPILESLLQCMRIIFSSSLSKSDVDVLKENIKNHLFGIIDIFKVNLIPKHHFLLHYPDVISKIGPVINNWMMRYEAKHKVFTTLAKQTNNFVNLSKTLAERHQEIICGKVDSFKDEIIKSSKEFPISNCREFKNYRSFFNQQKDLKIYELKVLKFLKINGILYKKGLMLVENTNIYEIIYVLQNKNNEYMLICHIYDFIKFNIALNSIEVKKTLNCKVLSFSQFLNRETHEKKICNNSIYLLANNLNVYKNVL